MAAKIVYSVTKTQPSNKSAYGATFEGLTGYVLPELRKAIGRAVRAYTLGGGDYNKSVVDKVFETFDTMTEELRHEVHYKRHTAKDGAECIAFDIKRAYDNFLKYQRARTAQGERLDFSMFKEQLCKKNYFLDRNVSVSLKEENNPGASHTVKCYLLKARELSESADVSNILERCGITLTERPSGASCGTGNGTAKQEKFSLIPCDGEDLPF